MAAANVGQNADLVVAAGNTLTGTSGVELDSSTAAATDAQMRIFGLAQKADNEIGDQAKWLVTANRHELKASAGV